MAEDTWMLKHPGRPGGVVSPIPYCGYDAEEIESIVGAGYVLTKNGQAEPLPGAEPAKKEDAQPKKPGGRKKK